MPKFELLNGRTMEMHQVRYFLALCEERNFTRAAKRCGVAQPSLTRAIHQLEAEFGALLFVRDRTSTRLTDLGILVRPDLVRIDQSAAETKRKAGKFLAARSVEPQPRAMEALMRVVSVAVVTVVILAAGLILRPEQRADELPPAQAGVTIDASALQLTIDVKSLPEQEIGDVI